MMRIGRVDLDEVPFNISTSDEAVVSSVATGCKQSAPTTINSWEVVPASSTHSIASCSTSISSPSASTFLASPSLPEQLGACSSSSSLPDQLGICSSSTTTHNLAAAAAIQYRQRQQLHMQPAGPAASAPSTMLHSNEPQALIQVSNNSSSNGDSPPHAAMPATGFASNTIPSSSAAALPSLPLKPGFSTLYGRLRSSTPVPSYLSTAPAVLRPPGRLCQVLSQPPLPASSSSSSSSSSSAAAAAAAAAAPPIKHTTSTNSNSGNSTAAVQPQTSHAWCSMPGAAAGRAAAVADTSTDQPDMLALLLSAANLSTPEAAAATAGMPGQNTAPRTSSNGMAAPAVAAAGGLWAGNTAAAGGSKDVLLQEHKADLMQQLQQLQANQASKHSAAAAAAASGNLLGDYSGMFAPDQATTMQQQLSAATAVTSAPLLGQVPAHFSTPGLPHYAAAAAATAVGAAAPVLAAHMPIFGSFGAAAMNAGSLQDSTGNFPHLLSQLQLPTARTMDPTAAAAAAAAAPNTSNLLLMGQLPPAEVRSYPHAANDMLTLSSNMHLSSRHRLQGLPALQGSAASQLLNLNSSCHNSNGMMAGTAADAASCAGSSAASVKGEHGHHYHGCSSSHSHSGPNNSLYKTELCRTWLETGSCRYGARCQFAHGEQELRPVARPAKYKTQPCRTFSLTGKCPYGARCNFIHGEAHLLQQGWLGRISSSGSSSSGGAGSNCHSSGAGDAGSSSGPGGIDASVFIGPAAGALFCGSSGGSTGKNVAAGVVAGSGDGRGGSAGRSFAPAALAAIPGLSIPVSSNLLGNGNGGNCLVGDGLTALSALAMAGTGAGTGPISTNSISSASIGGAAAAVGASPLMLGSLAGGEAAPAGAVGMGLFGGVGAFGSLLLQ